MHFPTAHLEQLPDGLPLHGHTGDGRKEALATFDADTLGTVFYEFIDIVVGCFLLFLLTASVVDAVLFVIV
jgi:hypothetical protein